MVDFTNRINELKAIRLSLSMLSSLKSFDHLNQCFFKRRHSPYKKRLSISL